MDATNLCHADSDIFHTGRDFGLLKGLAGTRELTGGVLFFLFNSCGSQNLGLAHHD